jgi:hypothetical protein
VASFARWSIRLEKEIDDAAQFFQAAPNHLPKKGNDFMVMLLAALLVASDPAVTPQQQPNQASIPAIATPAPAPKKERMICKSDPEFTGSRIEKQICLTKEQWKRRSAAEAAEGASN